MCVGGGGGGGGGGGEEGEGERTKVRECFFTKNPNLIFLGVGWVRGVLAGWVEGARVR